MGLRITTASGLVLAALLVAGCGRGEDRTPGAISASEQQQLNDAAAMLDANSMDADSVAENGSE